MTYKSPGEDMDVTVLRDGEELTLYCDPHCKTGLVNPQMDTDFFCHADRGAGSISARLDKKAAFKSPLHFILSMQPSMFVYSRLSANSSKSL